MNVAIPWLMPSLHAADVAAGETSDGPASEEATTCTDADPDHVAVALHHAHLPRLADAGVLVYDAETKTVTPRYVERYASFLRSVDGDDEN